MKRFLLLSIKHPSLNIACLVTEQLYQSTEPYCLPRNGYFKTNLTNHSEHSQQYNHGHNSEGSVRVGVHIRVTQLVDLQHSQRTQHVHKCCI